MAKFPAQLQHIRDRAARECVKQILQAVDLDAIVWPYKWCDRDDTNLFDTAGEYWTQTISTASNIKRVLLRATHDCDSVTFELQELRP